MPCMQKHVGARNEMVAVAWLLDKGYEVFRNVSQCGEIDIIATKSGELLRLDVKAAPAGNKQADRLTDSQVAQGIKRLNVYPDGRCELVEAKARAPIVPGICPNCRKEFSGEGRRGSIYCSRSCSQRHRYDLSKAARMGLAAVGRAN